MAGRQTTQQFVKNALAAEREQWTGPSAQHTPGPWRIVKVLNKARETRLAVARDVGAHREYVCSASGKRSTFCTDRGARAALRAANAIAKANGSAS